MVPSLVIDTTCPACGSECREGPFDLVDQLPNRPWRLLCEACGERWEELPGLSKGAGES